jgi:NTE family protein
VAQQKKIQNIAISLTGGGARGSYQAGVLKGISEILKEQNLTGLNNPFQYWFGVSAGAINAASCAAGADDLDNTCDKLMKLWSEITPELVYCTDFKTLSKNSLKWIRDFTFGSAVKDKLAKSFLDTKPLWDLINKNISFEHIDSQIKNNFIKGVACSAYSYTDNRTVTYIQSQEEFSWNRHRRYSKKIDLKAEHVIASCAIPLLFPSIKIGNEHFADGSFRNLSPISPLIHMGAQKILVVGVRGKDEIAEKQYKAEPGLARISGLILNALFFDTIEIDLERVRHINEMVTAFSGDIETKRSDYTRIEYHVIRPSKDIALLAMQKIKKFPKMINYLLGSLGPLNESSELASYILFDSSFTKEMVELGYSDVRAQKDELMAWLEK